MSSSSLKRLCRVQKDVGDSLAEFMRFTFFPEIPQQFVGICDWDKLFVT